MNDMQVNEGVAEAATAAAGATPTVATAVAAVSAVGFGSSQAIELVDFHWSRTTLYLEVNPATPFKPEDKILLRRPREAFDEDGNKLASDIVLGESFYEGPTSWRVRPIVAYHDRAIPFGEFDAFIVREGEDLPLTMASFCRRSGELATRRDDALLYFKTGHHYEILTYPNDEGQAHFEVLGRAPVAPRFNVKRRFVQAFVSFAKNMHGVVWTSTERGMCKHAKQHNKIVFTSDRRSEIGGNMEPLLRRMEERGITKDYKIAYDFTNEKGSRGIGAYLKLAWDLATAKVVFCDDYQLTLYRADYQKGTRIVQLWHACGAFKTVGMGRIGTLDAVSPFAESHRCYTDVIVAAEKDEPIYAEAFGIPESRVKALGIPRHDWILDPAWQEDKRAFFKKIFPGAAGKRVIVFAPTFRGAGKNSAYFDYNYLDLGALGAACRKNNWFLILKMHPFITQMPSIPAEYADIIVDGSAIPEINDILPSTDVLVTDYSSTCYEAALLDIPTLYYVFDLNNYVATRNFYEDFESFVSGKIVYTQDELTAAIEQDDFDLERLQVFKAKSFKHLDGKACDRIIDEVLL